MRSQGKILLAGLAMLAVGAWCQKATGTILPPGGTVVPSLIAPGTSPGTLVAAISAQFSFTTTAGTTSGTIVSAVYREAGGTLDFYYQVNDGASSTSSIAREADTSYMGWTTDVNYRTDGSSLTGGGFVNGTLPPLGGDRDIPGSTIGFNFTPPVSSQIAPGTSSDVLIIKTNATSFTAGDASVIDGGAATVASFQPVPEPAGIAVCVLAGGLLLRRRSRSV
jgi:hypothetical protein